MKTGWYEIKDNGPELCDGLEIIRYRVVENVDGGSLVVFAHPVQAESFDGWLTDNTEGWSDEDLVAHSDEVIAHEIRGNGVWMNCDEDQVHREISTFANPIPPGPVSERVAV